MPKSRKCLKSPRSTSFSQQNGRCYYCDQPMWVNEPSELSNKYNISHKQAKNLRCTGEHLIAHQDGGNAKKNNIVAACWCCNQRRHQRKKAPNPKEYKKLVQQRMNQGRWHSFRL
jgi:HNH endonuclease